MNAGTMGRDEAVEVLAALVDFVCAEMRGLESKPKLKAAIATQHQIADAALTTYDGATK